VPVEEEERRSLGIAHVAQHLRRVALHRAHRRDVGESLDGRSVKLGVELDRHDGREDPRQHPRGAPAIRPGLHRAPEPEAVGEVARELRID
jgi:hypothetical protein